jgi:hypothetical protein
MRPPLSYRSPDEIAVKISTKSDIATAVVDDDPVTVAKF